MIREIDRFYEEKEEPAKSCLLAMRNIILNHHENITEAWKYRMPFFCFREKMFCYLWVEKKSRQTYMGVMGGSKITHPKLITTTNTKVKKFLIDPESDLPLNEIRDILNLATSLHESLPQVKRKLK